MAIEMKIPSESEDTVSLLEFMSGFGRHQQFQYALVLLPIMFTAMSNANFVFSSAAEPYRCTIPHCEESNASASVPGWWPTYVTDAQCFKPEETAPGSCNFTRKKTACDAWIYNENNSIVSEFGLECQDWKRSLVGTVHNAGVFFSMPIMGFISDKWGRRTAILLSSSGLMLGAFKTLVPPHLSYSYLLYVILELLEATVVTGSYTTCFIMMLEIIGKNNRIFSSTSLGIAISLGELTLAGVVWCLPYWRHFQLAIYCPPVLFLFYSCVLNESVRWLIVNGHNEKALSVIKIISRRNNIVVSDKMILAIRNSKVTFDGDEEVQQEQFNILMLIKSKRLLLTLLMCSWWWFTSAFVFYGLMVNSVSLPGNKLRNFALSASAAIPGEIMSGYLLNAIGRKRTLMAGFFLCAIFCGAPALIPQEQASMRVAVFLLSKLCISGCFNCVYAYTSELVPTSARGSLVGACSMVARFGSVLAPSSTMLSSLWSPMPLLMMGAASLVAGFSACLAPETRSRRLPDTLRQAEQAQSQC